MLNDVMLNVIMLRVMAPEEAFTAWILQHISLQLSSKLKLIGHNLVTNFTAANYARKKY
jgi:hypothetical protein